MRLVETDDQDDGESDDLISAIAQLEEELAALKASQALFPELLAQMKEEKIERVAKGQNTSTNISFGNNNTGFQVGVSHGAISGIKIGK